MFAFPLEEASLEANKKHSAFLCLFLPFKIPGQQNNNILTACKRPAQTQARESQRVGREVDMKSHPLTEDRLTFDCYWERESQFSLIM